MIFLTTESGDFLITEDGRFLILDEIVYAEIRKRYIVLSRITEFEVLSRTIKFKGT